MNNEFIIDAEATKAKYPDVNETLIDFVSLLSKFLTLVVRLVDMATSGI